MCQCECTCGTAMCVRLRTSRPSYRCTPLYCCCDNAAALGIIYRIIKWKFYGSIFSAVRASNIKCDTSFPGKFSLVEPVCFREKIFWPEVRHFWPNVLARLKFWSVFGTFWGAATPIFTPKISNPCWYILGPNPTFVQILVILRHRLHIEIWTSHETKNKKK